MVKLNPDTPRKSIFIEMPGALSAAESRAVGSPEWHFQRES